MKVQTEAKTRDKDIIVENESKDESDIPVVQDSDQTSDEMINVTSDDQFNDQVEIPDECHIATPEQLSNDVLALVQSEIQTLFANTLVQESMEISNIVALVCDHPLDDVSVSISSEIQVIFTNMSVPDFMVTPKLVALVHIQQDEYYEVYPLLPVAYKKKVIYSKIILTSDICKRTDLQHNLIIVGYGS